MEPTIIIGVLLILIALYYGLGRNLEVSSRMLTRELEDAERSQKVSIVQRHHKETINEDDWKKAVENINLIDALDI